jgi:hypothetical protein
MYLEADDPCDVVSSSSNYYQDSDDYGAEYNAGLGGSYAELNGSYDAAPPSPGAKQRDRDAVPEFLKQERAVQAAIEAAKKKQEFMVYKVCWMNVSSCAFLIFFFSFFFFPPFGIEPSFVWQDAIRIYAAHGQLESAFSGSDGSGRLVRKVRPLAFNGP